MAGVQGTTETPAVKTVTWGEYFETNYNKYVNWTKTNSIDSGTKFTIDAETTTISKVMKVAALLLCSSVLLPLSCLFHAYSWAKENLCNSVCSNASATQTPLVEQEKQA